MKISAQLLKAAFVTFVVGFILSCTEQHDPTGHWEKMDNETAMAHKAPMKLTKDGKIPSEGGAAAKISPIDKKYNNFCASCHGADGSANSPVAKSMNPIPRNFTGAAWQDSVDDARIAKVIKEGGASVGLSPTMAAWGAMLSDKDIEGLVKKIRGYKK